MLAPHWMDEAFKRPKKFLEDILASSRFIKAVQKAEKAFQETREDIEADPDIWGPTPEQAARIAFLEALNDPK